MIFVYILLLVFFSFMLIRSADFVVISLKRISRKLHAGTFAISAVILALGTSFPEMFVSLTSAVEGSPSIALGVVVGANIANISLIAGVAGVAAGKIYIRGDYLQKDVWIALVSGLAPFVLLLDGSLSRADGIVLVAMYLAYASSFFKTRYIEVGKHQEADQFIYRFVRQFNVIEKGAKRDALRLVFGLVLLTISADMVVRIAKLIALSFNLPLFVVGLVVLSVGTSLPELVFSFRSIKSHETGMFFGNILGSIIANSTLILGLTVLISPIGSSVVRLEYVIAAIAFFLLSTLFVFFANTKRELDWWESLLILSLYVAFVVIETCGCFF